MSGTARSSLLLVTAILIAACGPVAGSIRPQPSPTPTGSVLPSMTPTGNGLPPCATVTATGCDPTKLLGRGQGSSGCVGKGPGTITASPIAVDDLGLIQPMGEMIGGHVTPIDHGYFYARASMATPPRQTAVYSPLAGNVAVATRTVRQHGIGNVPTYDDYAITIEATCTFRVRFSNMTGFSGALGTAVGQLQANESKSPNYAVTAGELIGYTGPPTAYGIDVWVEDDDLTLTGFINPAQYTAAEAWKTHMADLFDHAQEPLRGQLLGLLMRDALPRWGKIDYDIDGKLVGNWFRVGSGGYAGLAAMREGYWDGHLAVAYDANDPEQIDISFGNYQGASQQFAVIGNTPDPATVDISTGLVRYQLGSIEYYSGSTGQVWDRRSYLPHIRTRAGTTVMGTVLMQLMATRSLKIEIFPGTSAGKIVGFDASAVMFER
jgi:hypothetical protein